MKFLTGVVKESDIGKIYMPGKAHTTIIFEESLLVIQEKGDSITKNEAGVCYFRKMD